MGFRPEDAIELPRNTRKLPKEIADKLRNTHKNKPPSDWQEHKADKALDAWGVALRDMEAHNNG